MKIEADVRNIENLEEYFFVVPDYQREYVWESDKHVFQILNDIENEFDENKDFHDQTPYFIGSIIIVKGNNEYEVIDGQQRLTTIILTLCAIRDFLKKQDFSDEQLSIQKNNYLDAIKILLFKLNIAENKKRPRLILQYEESKDYLEKIINEFEYNGETNDTIEKMSDAYLTIFEFISNIFKKSENASIKFIQYFLVNVELVVIKSENITSALKIFETINQRGVGLNAMDLLKNLIFRSSSKNDFSKIKEIWKKINANLEKCDEKDKPMRFLRYFLMARYYEGIIREDEIYNWIISDEGKNKIKYDLNPMDFANELLNLSGKYSKYVLATNNEDNDYLYLSRIGFLGRKTFRQHLILILAMNDSLLNDGLKLLSENLESLIFYYLITNENTKIFETKFSKWAKELRNIIKIEDLKNFILNKFENDIIERTNKFEEIMPLISQGNLYPQYRIKYLLGRLDEYMRINSFLPSKNLSFYQNLQLEHILPETPEGNHKDFSDEKEYQNYLYKLGNLTLVEAPINQAMNKFNKVYNNEWFINKKKEYTKSEYILTSSISEINLIGKQTTYNQIANKYLTSFNEWGKNSIEKRQGLLIKIIKDIWKIAV